MSTFPPNIHFEFPLAQPNQGIALGNGKLKLLVWGDELLCLTISRAGFGTVCDSELKNNEARALLEADDENGLRELLADSTNQTCSIASANIELRFANADRPLIGTLQANGILQIAFDSGRVVTVECAMDEELAWLNGASDAQWNLNSSWEENRVALEERGISAPLEIRIDDGQGLIQEQLADENLALMVRQREQHLFIATALGETEEAAKSAVTRARCKPDINPIYYWKQYWRATPRVTWPDAHLQKLWNIALFKQGQLGATNAATTDFIAAFTELLAQSRSDNIHVTPVIPHDWRDLSFDNVRCAGGFIIGADVKDGAVIEVRVKSENGGLLRLRPTEHAQVEREMEAGEEWVWQNY